ncbi:MAG: HlyD family efflux transporter periplasmic adaptor subunit [Leptospiraceae bacterium]|nr:HlyD family efflux transporter periplasmic adaptor subunit [Leptospiraceae bacterium]MCP5501400.1 HlyD family efflux transporter periplasmic adaptor subunit [Leptospiraceae bacterium]
MEISISEKHEEENVLDKFSSYRLVQSPHSLRIAAYIIAGLFVFFVLLLFLSPWQQTSFGMGRVVAREPLERQQFIDSPVKGRVSQWFVREGSLVKKGDPIVEIMDNDPEYFNRLESIKLATESRLQAAELQKSSYLSKINSISSSVSNEVEAKQNKVSMAEQKIRNAENKLIASEAELKTSEINFERTRKLYEKGLVSKRKYELEKLYLTKNKTGFKQAKANLQIAKNEHLHSLAELKKARNEGRAKLDGTRAEYGYALSGLSKAKEELHKIDTSLARQKAQKVYAPRDGIIMRILAVEHSVQIKQGQSLAILVPESGKYAVELYIDGNDIPLLREGMETRLQFQGWPALQLSGYPQLAVGTFGGTVRLVDLTDDGSGKFRTLIVPDEKSDWPSSLYLRQGVRTKGWILLNRVSLAYELWRRFNDFPPAIPNKKSVITEKKTNSGDKK